MGIDPTFDGVAASVLSRIRERAIDQDPFPHIVLKDVIADEHYRALMNALPDSTFFAKAMYPGTGMFTTRHGGRPTDSQGSQHHGLVLRQWTAFPLLKAVHDLLSSDAFARVLLDKFSDPHSRRGQGPAIPSAKHALFAGAATEYSCVFALHKDLSGYEISPHVDNPSKLVTFIWCLDDDRTTPCGTLLCRPKLGVDPAPLVAGGYKAAQGEGRPGLWMDWEKFDVVKSVSGPNVLLAFAPNDISYHGVKVPQVRCGAARGRTVVRGCVARIGYRDTTLLAEDGGEAK